MQLGLDYPLFRVVGKERSQQKVKPNRRLYDPQFSLVPTWTFYFYVGCGIVITSIPLLSRTLWLALLASTLLFVCCGIIICQLWNIERLLHRLGNRQDLLRAVPHTHIKRRLSLWLLCAFPVACIEAGLFITGLGKRSNAVIDLSSPSQFLHAYANEQSIWYEGSALGLLILLGSILWGCFSAAWMKYSPTFRLPELEGEYQTIGETAKEKVTQTTNKDITAPMATWRRTRNIAQQTHLAGIATAFFSVNIEGAVWKRSLRPFIWYFAPISVPLVMLLVLPQLVLAQKFFANLCVSHLCIDFLVPERYEFALAAVAWALWSSCAFVFLSEKDFGNQNADDFTKILARDVDVFYLGHKANSMVLKNYLADRGQAIMQILVLALLPMLLTYFGLFPEPVVPEKPSVTVKMFIFMPCAHSAASPQDSFKLITNEQCADLNPSKGDQR